MNPASIFCHRFFLYSAANRVVSVLLQITFGRGAGCEESRLQYAGYEVSCSHCGIADSVNLGLYWFKVPKDTIISLYFPLPLPL